MKVCRPRLAALAAVLALLGCTGLVACGSDSGDGRPRQAASPRDQTPGPFPVTITDAFGTTAIEHRPERVVTLGYTDHDPVLALGTVPVMLARWIDSYPKGVGPWAEPLLGTHPPKVITGEQIPYERVAAAHPDLIVAIYRALTPEQYDKLARIAPVVAKPKGDPDYGTSWQQTTRMVGKALGKEDRAARLIRHVRQLYAKARREHSEFAGRSAVIAMVQPGGKYYAYSSADPRSRAMASLGFDVSTKFDKAAGSSFYTTISQERLGLLNADVLVLIGPDSALAAARKDPLLRKLPVARQGHVLYLGDALMNAFSHNDVLSIPWTLHKLLPRLASTVGS